MINAVCRTDERHPPRKSLAVTISPETEVTSVHLAHHAGQQSHDGITGQLNPKLLTIIVVTERACDESLLPEDEL